MLNINATTFKTNAEAYWLAKARHFLKDTNVISRFFRKLFGKDQVIAQLAADFEAAPDKTAFKERFINVYNQLTGVFGTIKRFLMGLTFFKSTSDRILDVFGEMKQADAFITAIQAHDRLEVEYLAQLATVSTKEQEYINKQEQGITHIPARMRVTSYFRHPDYYLERIPARTIVHAYLVDTTASLEFKEKELKPAKQKSQELATRLMTQYSQLEQQFPRLLETISMRRLRI